MRYLKQNTAVRITVGPFMDGTDGITPETGIAVTGCHLTMTKDDDDGTAVNLILDTAPTTGGGNNDMIHIVGDDAGFYDLELTAANTNYLGRAMLAITDPTVHCPVFHELTIIPSSIYDSMILGTDTLPVDPTGNINANITQWNGENVASGAIPPYEAGTQSGLPTVDASGYVQADVWSIEGDSTPIDGKTFAAALRYIAAICAGKITGAQTGQETFKGLDGSTNRVVVDVDSSGNRTGITYDP